MLPRRLMVAPEVARLMERQENVMMELIPMLKIIKAPVHIMVEWQNGTSKIK